MNKQLKVKVQNQYFTISRDLLINQTQNQQLKNTKENCLSLPQWASKQAFLLIVHYLKTSNINFLHRNLKDTSLVVILLRTSDYLGLTQFQNRFIKQLLISAISFDNCLVLLHESHRKLKNMQNSKIWFKLLNQGICFLSDNLFEIYKMNPQKLKNLNEKIMNEVLDIVIRKQRKICFVNQHILFQLMIQCKLKEGKGPESICKYLRSNLQNKNIAPKIHAKLSWKLQKIQQISSKKTKVFKFLDFQWYLAADRSPQGLLVTLNLVPYPKNISTTNVSGFNSQSSSHLGVESPINSEKLFLETQNNEEVIKNDKYMKIGIFYSKVLYQTQEMKSEKQIKIHYIQINKPKALPIINFSPILQNQIGTKRVQLSILFNIDLIYTFVNNYVFTNFEGLSYKGKDFCRQELENMIQTAKNIKQFTKALQLTNQYLYAHKEKQGQIVQRLFMGYHFQEMTKIQIQIYQNLKNSVRGPSPPVNFISNIQPEKNKQQLSNFVKKNHAKSVNNGSQQKQINKNLLAISPISSVAKMNNANELSRQSKNSSFKKQSTSHQKGIKSSVQKDRLSSYFDQTSNSLYLNSNPRNISHINDNIISMSRQNNQRVGMHPYIKKSNKLDEVITNSLNNSLNNSRTNSKRKIFNKPKSSYQKGEQNQDLRAQSNVNFSRLMQEVQRITNFATYLSPNADPYVANSIRQIYL